MLACPKLPLLLLPILLLCALPLHAGSLQAMQPAGWEYPTWAGRQFCSLLRRELLAITRNPYDVAGRWVHTAAIAGTNIVAKCQRADELQTECLKARLQLTDSAAAQCFIIMSTFLCTVAYTCNQNLSC
jgi:hypothetical protein